MALKTSMLEYCKIILKKFSFNRKLFLKEYRKGLRYLNNEERISLRQWAKSNIVRQADRKVNAA